MSNPKTTLNKVKTLLGMNVALESMKLDNGTMLEADSFEAGSEVFIVSGEEKVALPVGEYTMEDGKELIVQEEGIIAEIKEPSEDAPEEAPEEAPKEAEAELEAVEPTPKKIVTSEEVHFSSEELKSLFEDVAELKVALSKILEEKTAELSVEKTAELSVEKEVVEDEPTELHSHNPLKRNTQTQPKRKLSKKELIWQTINNA